MATEKVIKPLSEDIDKTTLEIKEIMYNNLLTKGATGLIGSMDMETLAELILTIPDRSGINGWTLVPAIAINGNKCALKMAGWLLNIGNPPPSNVYLGYAGLVSDINEAVNIRGQDGLTTDITLNGNIFTHSDGNIVLPDLLPVGHNTSNTSHEDIRTILANVQKLLESDDDTLDELKEVVEYIKSNRELIESITIKKLNISDIVNDLISTNINKPLSANMGNTLKKLADTKQPKGDYATNASVDQKISDIQLPDVGGSIGVHNISTQAHNDIRLLITNLDNAKQANGSYVLTSDTRLTNARAANGGNSDTVGKKTPNEIFANYSLLNQEDFDPNTTGNFTIAFVGSVFGWTNIFQFSSSHFIKSI